MYSWIRGEDAISPTAKRKSPRNRKEGEANRAYPITPKPKAATNKPVRKAGIALNFSTIRTHPGIILDKGKPICTIQLVSEKRNDAINRTLKVVSEIYRSRESVALGKHEDDNLVTSYYRKALGTARARIKARNINLMEIF